MQKWLGLGIGSLLALSGCSLLFSPGDPGAESAADAAAKDGALAVAADSAVGDASAFPTAALNGLFLSHGELNPEFSPTIISYEIALPTWVHLERIEGQSNVPSAEVQLNGESIIERKNVPVAMGDNTFTIDVSAIEHVSSAYTIDINRSNEFVAETVFGKAQDPNVNARMGFAIASSGNRLVVGLPVFRPASQPSEVSGGSGAVQVYRRVDGLWMEEQLLTADNAGSGDFFGGSVAIHNDTIVIGAPGEDSSSTGADALPSNEESRTSDSGAAYVFELSQGEWVQTQFIKGSIPTAIGDAFGSSVGIFGNVLAVGAPGKGPGAFNSGNGGVEVFEKSGANWEKLGESLTTENPSSTAEFGTAIAMTEQFIAVGSPGESGPSDNKSNVGALYLYHLEGGSPANVVLDNRVTATSPLEGERMGASVALFGETVAAGGDGENVHVFQRNGGQWGTERVVQGNNTRAGDRFGISVALHGDLLAVGAHREASSTGGIASLGPINDDLENSGAAYVFVLKGDKWEQDMYIKSSNPQNNERFGRSVRFFDAGLAIGAVGNDSSQSGINPTTVSGGILQESGAFYVFE